MSDKSYQKLVFHICLVLVLFFVSCKDQATEKEVLHCYTPANSGILQIDPLLKTIPQRKDTSHKNMV
jgi:hypothetical protein